MVNMTQSMLNLSGESNFHEAKWTCSILNPTSVRVTLEYFQRLSRRALGVIPSAVED